MHRPSLAILALLVLVLLVPPAPGHAGKLGDDGRAGVVLDVQGTALVRPAGHARWTPLGAKSVLHPGDVVRTQARGAHALEIQLSKGKALLGPGVELQITAEGFPRLLRGEAELIGTPEEPFAVRAAGDFAADLKGTAWLRAQDKRTEQLEKAPRWVEGYRASASDEWMGSLLAKVDGRNVPLAVGYHKVDVEVRDQIARTTVEQSFVNATKGRLEGVFYFPLPADASISGFAMWIGDELVEADIVERQRARQIYEDILRRKKDPGLLEWEGGNIFKARVFPIEPFSEKRIRIRYTQVLPLEGDTYRYRYALRSELLRTKPLRELQIAVRVMSTQPMKAIASPTHEVTTQSTGHEATAMFRASEYRPTRDFELAVTVDRGQPVTAIPHRRGEDGYFMLMVAPPTPEAAAWQRELAPEGAPLDVMLLADTSGSMDDTARANQAAFLEGLLAMLGSKDRFRLAAFDADVAWLVGEPTAPSEESIQSALDALAARRSLGWSDLDAGFAAALAGAKENTLVVYVGDGVSTTGDADSADAARRMRALGQASKASIHAVAASSSFDQGVLRALAETGGGSVRTVGAHPAADAYGLLSEAARPSVKDLKVRIEGIRTARVYPERLPNLPLGSQQVMLGRFLPSDTPQEGRVVVEGTLDGKSVRYVTPLRIPAADVGNSFLPRLWGRKHIDALLAQGGPEINEEIITFSERFGIMTPLTSFLVLESDEDRERYGVARRVRMRDGERFFAEAKDRATLEQRRALMQQSGRWRLGLRRNALREIARLGRDLTVHGGTPPESLEAGLAEVQGFGFTTFGSSAFATKDGDTFFTDRIPAMVDRGLTTSTAMRYEDAEVEEELMALQEVQNGLSARTKSDSRSWGAKSIGGGGGSGPMTGSDRGRSRGGRYSGPMPTAPPPPTGAATPMAKKVPARRSRLAKAEDAAKSAGEELERNADMPPGDLDDLLEDADEESAGFAPAASPAMEMLSSAGRRDRRQMGQAGSWAGRMDPTYHRSYSGFTLQSLGFPAVPGAPREDETAGEPDWDPAVLALLRSLPRRDALRQLPGGVRIVIAREGLHPTRATVFGTRQIEAWIGTDAWLVQKTSSGFQERMQSWSHAGTRGAIVQARQLARTRDAKPTDANAWWLPVWDLRVRDVVSTWVRAGYIATLGQADGERAVVRLARRGDDAVLELLIDPTRRVLVETRWLDAAGRAVARLVRSDFVEVGGRHWARTVERFDREDRRVERRSLTVEALGDGALAKALTAADAARGDALTVHGPLPSRTEAKDAARALKATFLDQLVLCLHFAQQSRHDESLGAWDAAAALVDGKPGRPWVRTVLHGRARQGEAHKAWLTQRAQSVSRREGQDGRFLARWLHSWAQGIFGSRERGQLLESLRTRWVDEGANLARLRELDWQLARLTVHDALREEKTARSLRAALALAWPHRVDVQLAHEASQWNVGRYPQALALLEGALKTREPWTASERGAIYHRLTNRLWERRELSRLHDTLTAWVETKPRDVDAWQRWLSSFFFLGRSEEGDARIRDALSTTLDTKDPRWHAGRLAGGVALARGDGWNFHVGHVHGPLRQPLMDAILGDMRRLSKQPTVAVSAYHDWRFRRTDRHRAVRDALFADLQADDAIATMPRHKLARYMGLLPWQRGQAPDAAWAAALAGLKSRWSKSSDDGDRRAMEGFVLRVLDARGKREEAITFLEEALARAAEEDVKDAPRVARALFQRLLRTPDRDPAYGTAREDRAFALLPALFSADITAEQRAAQAARDVRTLADRVYRWRYAAGLGSPETRKDLTRAQQKVLRREVRTAVRGALAERLGAAEQRMGGVHAPWLQLERLGYAVEHGEALPALVAEAGTILARDWARPDPEGDLRPLDRVMRERAAVVLAYAATRSNASPELTQGVLETFARGEASEPSAASERDRARELLDWRYQTWRLLLALDDAPALEANLRRWIVPAKVESRWRVALAHVLAETGRVAEAATQFEAVWALDELAANDFATLASWYLVLDNDEARDRAILARYDRMAEHELSSLAYRYERQMRRRSGGVPGDFDPESVRVLTALMRKASYPGNHWYRVRNLYRNTKDFRLLAPVSEGLVGHTKEASYGFLQQLARIASEVHEEATLDAWTAALRGRITTAETPLDRRVLQLAIARVEGRASKVPETDPAHGARALAALKAAFPGEFIPGEPLLLAQYLRSLGKIEDAAVRSEQLRQLAALRDREPGGSLTRLRIAHAEAGTLWNYGMADQAIDRIAAELDAVRGSHDGRVPMDVVRIFDAHIHWLSQKARFAEAERVLLSELDRWDLPMRRRGISGRLYVLYVETLRRGGRVSLGRGATLFEAVQTMMDRAMAEEPAQMSAWLGTFCNLHRQGKAVGAPRDANTRLEAWASNRLPALLVRVPLNAANHTGTVAGTIRDISSPYRGVWHLMAALEREPSWLKRIGYTVWQRHAYSFARWRHEAGVMQDLDPKLEALVVGQLEHNLRNGGSHARWFWTRRNKYAWNTRFDTFADTAGRVAELNGSSRAVVVRCASFLRRTLGRTAAGRDMLAAAHERGLLSERDRWTLATWLGEDRLYARSLAMVDPLIEIRPENLRFRTHRIAMLAGLKRMDEVKADLESVARTWTEAKRWNESVAATLGRSAAKYGYPALAAPWLEEAIRMRQEARGNRGGRDSTLGHYYRDLALARAKLGDADGAVNAASTALLMANPRRQAERQAAETALHTALAAIPAFDAWLETYDAKVAESGLDAPVLRKAYARLLHERKDYAREIAQLLLARELDAGDADTHRRLVAAYDAAKDPAGAVDALFGSIELNPYDHAMYVALAKRFTAAGDSAGAERAYTTLAEISPHQPGGHRALATVREEQKRLPDAVVQWRQVVRTERTDPTGHLGLARALIAAGAKAEAREVLQGVLAGSWEPRFKDVKKQATSLLSQTEQDRNGGRR